jgi:hypothetical protein
MLGRRYNMPLENSTKRARGHVLKEDRPQRLVWKSTPSNTPDKKQTAWWGLPQNTLPDMGDIVLPLWAYEHLLDTLKDQPPFSPRDGKTELMAQTIALRGDRRPAEKLSNLSASNDPASLLLLAHFGNLSRFATPYRWKELSGFSMDPFPERGIQWAFDFFLRDMPIRPTTHHWRLALLFYLNLSMITPTEHPVARLLDVLRLPVSQGIWIPASTFHLILNHIAISSEEYRPWQPKSLHPFRQYVTLRLQTMILFLNVMKTDFGYDIVRDEEVYLALYKACCQRLPTLAHLICNLDRPLPYHYVEQRGQNIENRFIENLRLSPEFYMLRLLHLAHMRQWRSFMARWKWAQDFGISKDADLWALFWACLARSRNESRIRTALKHNYDEMMDEEHLVLNRNIVAGLAKCLSVVDPFAREFKKERKAVSSALEIPN